MSDQLMAELIDGTNGPIDSIYLERRLDIVWRASADDILRLISVCKELDYIYEMATPGTVWARFKERIGAITDEP